MLDAEVAVNAEGLLVNCEHNCCANSSLSFHTGVPRFVCLIFVNVRVINILLMMFVFVFSPIPLYIRIENECY